MKGTLMTAKNVYLSAIMQSEIRSSRLQWLSEFQGYVEVFYAFLESRQFVFRYLSSPHHTFTLFHIYTHFSFGLTIIMISTEDGRWKKMYPVSTNSYKREDFISGWRRRTRGECVCVGGGGVYARGTL